jgi:hypothetical protein
LYGGEWIRCHGKLTRVESRMNECKIWEKNKVLGLWRRNINITITILDFVHRSGFYYKKTFFLGWNLHGFRSDGTYSVEPRRQNYLLSVSGDII